MNRSQQPSFSVKISHPVINNEQEQQPNNGSYYFNFTSDSSNTQQKTYTSLEKQRKQGSGHGMSIRTTNSGAEDFY